MRAEGISVNRAPVMTLWAAVVAERLGHDPDGALTIGHAVAGLNAQAKGRRLGIFDEKSEIESEAPPATHRPERERLADIMGRKVPTVDTPDGERATIKGRPIDPASVVRYLQKAFGSELAEVRAAMVGLAHAYPPRQLGAMAYALYEQFRPAIPEGTKGWGAKGRLKLEVIRKLAVDARR